MESNKWQLAERFFHEALTLGPAERQLYLRSVCKGDEELLAEVNSLLDSFDSSNDQPVAPSVARPSADFESVGPYHLEKLLGEGGMGAVYLASRADQEFDKKVAIKLIRRGPGSDALLGRFLKERQILAGMEHPNIARLLDGGTDNGRPYLVMDYIEGERLDHYCDQRRLTLPGRLRLFRKVCAAVNYAHQHLVVHRDLKPTNVLVSSDGEPKLLDFGIATVLQSTAGGTDLTATQGQFFTPQYSSPEQIRGRRATVASDTYSLGVILYELLCGFHPYQADTDSPVDLITAIVAGDPPMPSSAATGTAAENKDSAKVGRQDPAQLAALRGETPESLRKTLRGDLDSIVMKALANDPKQRYSSVEQFSEDIRLYLDGLPVMAVEGSSSYRFKKFLKRHKAGAAATGFAALLLIAGLAGILWEAHIAKIERTNAEARFDDARKLARYLIFELYGSVQRLPGATPVQAEMAQRSLEYLDKLAAVKSDDPELRCETAEGYIRLGDILGDPFQPNLGKSQDALSSYRKAIALVEPLVVRDPNYRRAKSVRGQATLRMGGILTFSGQRKEGVAAMKSAAKDFTFISDAAETDPKRRIDAGDAYYVLGRQLSQSGGWVTAGDKDEALMYLQKGLEHFEAALALAPGNTLALRKISLSNRIIAGIVAVSDPQKAIGMYETALKAIHDLPESDRSGDGSDPRRNRAGILLNLGWAQGQVNDYKNAISSLSEARDILKAFYELDPQNTANIYHRSASYRSLGIVYGYAGNKQASIENFKLAVEMFDKLLKRDPGNETYQTVRAEVQMRIGNLLAETGQPLEAATWMASGLDYTLRQARRPDANFSQLSEAARYLTHSKVKSLRNYPLALQFARKAAELTKFKDPLILEYLASAYWCNGDFDAAHDAVEKALSFMAPTQPGATPSRGRQALEEMEASIRAHKKPDS